MLEAHRRRGEVDCAVIPARRSSAATRAIRVRSGSGWAASTPIPVSARRSAHSSPQLRLGSRFPRTARPGTLRAGARSRQEVAGRAMEWKRLSLEDGVKIAYARGNRRAPSCSCQVGQSQARCSSTSSPSSRPPSRRSHSSRAAPAVHPMRQWEQLPAAGPRPRRRSQYPRAQIEVRLVGWSYGGLACYAYVDATRGSSGCDRSGRRSRTSRSEGRSRRVGRAGP